MKVIRWLLGRLILLGNFVFSPRGIKRTAEQQQQIDEKAAKLGWMIQIMSASTTTIDSCSCTWKSRSNSRSPLTEQINTTMMSEAGRLHQKVTMTTLKKMFKEFQASAARFHRSIK